MQSLTLGDPDGPGPIPRSLIVGGTFTYVGSVRSTTLAYYNPTSGWVAMGRTDGSGENLFALTTWNDTIIAGGIFGTLNPTTPPGTQPRNVAAWNGSRWMPMSTTQLNAAVNSLASVNGVLYAAGRDPSPPSTFALYRYAPGPSIDSGSWVPLLSDVRGATAQVIVHNNELYLIGNLYRDATPSVRFQVAKLNAAGTDVVELPSLGTNNGLVNGGVVYQGELYIFGSFTASGGAPANVNRVAKLNAAGTAWVPSTTQASNALAGSVLEFTSGAVLNTELVLGSRDGLRPLAVLTGSNGGWSLPAVAAGGPGSGGGSIQAMSPTPDGTRLVLGSNGSFDTFQPTSATRLAFWERATNTYSPPAAGFSDFGFGYPFVNAAASLNGTLYLGGGFGGIGTQRGRSLARFDGTTLSPVPGAPAAEIKRLFSAENNTAIYLAGDATRLTRFDGSTFTTLTDSFNGTYASGVAFVEGLTEYNGAIVIGGRFSATAPEPSYIMRRTGGSWTSIGNVQPNGNVTALTTFSSPLIAGGATLLVASGQFTQVGTLAARVAAWDGTSWRALGQSSFISGYSANPAVSLFSHQGDLHMAAYMNGINGSNNYPIIIRYNPASDSWTELPRPVAPVASGFGLPVRAISAAGSIWVATTGYSVPGMSDQTGLLRWNGATWSNFGGVSGLFPQVTDVAFFNNDIVITGLFGQVGTQVPSQGSSGVGGITSVGWARLALGSTAPTIATQPLDASVCNGGTARFSVIAAGTPPFSYRWRRVDQGNVVTDLVDGPIPGGGAAVASGTATAALTMTNAGTAASNFRYVCAVTDACGSVTSNAATLRICIADLDDGSGSGTCDGGVGIDDLLYYLVVFDAGTSRADVDDGSGTGMPDGGVSIDDLLYYLVRFENGC